MNWIKWKKKDGTELESNDAESTVAYCESLGWERIGGDIPKDYPESGYQGSVKPGTPSEEQQIADDKKSRKSSSKR